MDFAVARRNMVESQVRTNKVTDQRVLDRMGSLPRELFVPKSRRTLAYMDECLQIGEGRYLMEPCALARLLQGAALQESDVALVIGCGTGYSAALMAGMAATVFGIDSDPELVAEAGTILSELAIDNVVIEARQHRDGWAEQGPYDVILIDGEVPEVPQSILDQLGEGGRLLAIVREDVAVARAMLYGKRFGSVSHCVLFDAKVGPCPGFEQKTGFVF